MYIRQGFFAYPEEQVPTSGSFYSRRFSSSLVVFRQSKAARHFSSACSIGVRPKTWLPFADWFQGPTWPHGSLRSFHRWIVVGLTRKRIRARKFQAEELDVKGAQEQAPGLHVVFLPFADDSRDLAKKLTACGDCPDADPAQVAKARSAVDKLLLNYSPDSIANPGCVTYGAWLRDVLSKFKPSRGFLMRLKLSYQEFLQLISLCYDKFGWFDVYWSLSYLGKVMKAIWS